LWENFSAGKQTSAIFSGVFKSNNIQFFNKTTWEENWDMCCSLGMAPIMVETVEHAQCLSNWTKGRLKDSNKSEKS